jgi:flagellar biosynthetic protein FlhB
MADSNDDGQKTEDPSQRRLQHARDEGRIAQSREINTWFILAATGIVLLFTGPSSALAIARAIAGFIEPQRYLAADGVSWPAVMASLRAVAEALVPPIGLLVVAAFLGSVVQTGFVLATERIGFDVSHLSFASGVSRIISFRSVVELGKSIVKIAAVGGIVVWLMRGEADRISMTATLSPEDALKEITHLVLRLLLGVLAVLTPLAAADYVYQRLTHIRSLRMSRREIKEEMKQSEGDPIVRGRLRQIRMERARRRMMAAVPGASVVITNPTHYAVALAYELGAAGAPKVVAKGTDLIALKIREIAEANGVPLVENPPLARALHAGVEIDREIPPEHYKAVAEIIGYVFRLKGKIKPTAAAV